MSKRFGRFVGIVVLAAGLVAPVAASARTADVIAPSDPLAPTVDSGWQAGTCKYEPPEVQAEGICSVATTHQFYETAAGHPKWGFTQFIVKHKTEEPLPGQKLEKPEKEVATIRVDLPVGLSVNPGATEVCPLATFKSGAANCESLYPESKVGESFVTTALPVTGIVTPPTKPLTQVPVFNVEPVFGEAARFGLELADNEVFLQGDVAWASDYHEGFTIDVPKTLPTVLGTGLVLKNRLVFKGISGDGTFLTTPSTCLGEAFPWGPAGHVYSTWLLAQSWDEKEEEEAGGPYAFPRSAEPPFESPIPQGTSPKKCGTIPYDPSIDVEPNTGTTNSPAGPAVEIAVPHLLPNVANEDEQDSSNTRSATVTLPAGMGLNPSAATGLKTCDDSQFGKGTEAPITCPPESIIGRAKIESPPLGNKTVPQPEEDLEGNVYAGKQLSHDPLSGNEYRIFVEAKSDRYGISVRLIGNVKANPATGQLSTTISEAPQVPFTSFLLTFNGGARAVLSSPPTCGPNQTTTAMTPWSGNPPRNPRDSFSLTGAPGGGPCAKTMAARPFTPSFALKPASSKAGAFSPLTMNVVRTDGQQELKGVDVTLPPGFSGRIKGIPYCSEAAIAAAATRAGADEAKSSSCPAASLLGSATVLAGTGPAPFKIGGKVFLSGPYHGAPLSLAVLTPATAGPFDLGTVVVRVALFVEPETAQIHAVSDPVPDVFGGAQLSIRSVDVTMDRPKFTLNPTSCGPLATTGTLAGGGADPTNPAAFSALAVSSPFQPSECGKLGFKPKLVTKLLGGRRAMKRAQHPRFRAVLTARPGDANVGRAAVTLPHSLFLDQGHINTICTRVQLAARDCPAGAVYGHAKAETPLLDEPLRGPVYLVSSNNPLPDLLADLHGQVNVRLHGVISSMKTGRIKNVFYPVPDVPVSRFTLNMRGGKKGLLTNSRNLCAHSSFSYMNFKAQNGKRLKKKKLKLRVPACAGKARKKRG